METTEHTSELQLAEAEKLKSVSAAWSKMGVAMRQTDMRLQAMAQKALAKIVIPKTTADIVAAEKLVIELNKDFTEIQTERKKLTGKLDGAITHLMQPENELKNAGPALKEAILALKKQAEQENAKLKYHDDEIKLNKELIANHISNHDAICKQKILTLVDKAYSFALGNGDVKVEELPAYLKKVINGEKAGEKEFYIVAPLWQSKYTTQEENQELWDNAVMDVRSPMDYRDDLNEALKEKFEFYNIAVKNKAESLKQAAAEKEAEENRIQQKKSEAETANKLNAMATTHTATQVTTHKDLKKVYEIEMIDQDWAVATQVLAAFVGNLDKCKAHLRVKDIFNLSVKQCAESLCKLKCSDPEFEFGSLKFKQVDKL